MTNTHTETGAPLRPFAATPYDVTKAVKAQALQETIRKVRAEKRRKWWELRR